LTNQYLLMYTGGMPVAPAARLTGADTVSLFHALSDATRLTVVRMLRGGERCVCDLQEAVGAAQSRLSFHLKVLKDAGLVTDRKEGRWSYYALNGERLREAAETLGVLATEAPTASARLYALGRGGQPKGRAVARGADCC
jgi:ArsR family transcriptional regulator